MSDNDFTTDSHTVYAYPSTDRYVTKNPDYSSQGIDVRRVNKYQFIWEAYQGSNGFCDGSYLMPHARESWFKERQAMAYYRNYTRPIADAIIDPVFNHKIVRETDDELYTAFLENVDSGGTDIESHLRAVTLLSRLHGNCFAVMENFTEQPASLEEAIATRTLPYLYIKPAYLVHSYNVDQFGNLLSITFSRVESMPDANGKNRSVTIYEMWDEMNLRVVKKDGDKIVSDELFPHNLGVLPIIQAPSVGKEVLPFPPFYDIAKINYSIFNKDSEIRDQERAQAFSIFYMQTDVPQNGIVLGPHNALILPASDQINITPGFVGPDSAILKTLVENNKELVDALFKAAQQQGVVAVRQQTSGVAEAYRFMGTNNQLRKTASIAEDYERKLVELFNIRTNRTAESSVTYTKEYSPAITADNVDMIMKVLAMEIPEPAKIEIRNTLVREVLNHLPQKEVAELLEGAA